MPLGLHPVEDVLRRPVATQADLHEVAAEHGAGLDQAAHRGAVARQVPVDDVGGVGVGVEMNDADVAPPPGLGHRSRRRPRDRVVTAHDDWDDAAAGHLADQGLDVGVPNLGLAVGAMGVTEVDDLEPVEDLDP
jgi:hypothetical protein